MSATIQDWTIRAAVAIARTPPDQYRTERIAATIATFAEPMVKLLRESIKPHHHCDDSWYCCPRCQHSDHGKSYIGPSDLCDCGADEWNKKVEAVLHG